MNTGWKTSTLGSVCKFENGDRGKNYPGRKAFVPTGIPFINAGHLDDGEINWQSMDFIPRERFDLLGNGKIQNGDLLFCLRGSLGKFGVVNKDTEGAIASSLVIVRPATQLDGDFLAAYFRSEICAEMISKYANGAAQPNLSAKSLKSFELPLPPLPEQKRIAAILDEAFEGIGAAVANAEKNLASSRELFESYLQSVFAQQDDVWPAKKLGEMCEKITDGTHNSPPYVDSGIPMLDSKHIGENFTIDDSSSEKFISPETDALLSRRCKPLEGDILVSSRGTIGKIAIVAKDQNFNIMGNMILIRLPAAIDREFVAYFLQSKVTHIESISRGVAQKGLYLGQIRDYEILLPPTSQQTQIAARLGAISMDIRRLQAIYQQKLDTLAELKQSILQKAFSGELTAQPQTLKDADA